MFIVFSQCINFYFIDDHCQYWLNKANGTLKSPNFGINDLGNNYRYEHDLNCTWILSADQGHYITLEIEHFSVNNDSDTIFICTTSLIKDYHFRFLIVVTISQSLMDQISNYHQYQNWNGNFIFIKKAFQVQDLTCWFNLWQMIYGPPGDSQLKSIIHQSI